MKKFLLLLSVLFVVSCSKDAEPIKYTLTTTVSPADSGTINPNGGTVDEGQQISVTAAPAGEYVFDKWTGAASGTNKTVSVIMDSDKSVTSNFVKKKYNLTINTVGEGTISQKVIKAGAATDYNSGSEIELTATGDSPWSFSEWTGDLTGNTNPKEITLDNNKTVTAVFELLINSYKIYVSSSSSADFNLTRKDRNGDVSGNDPVLSFNVGDQVTFIIDTTDFYLKTKPGIDTGNKIDVENNGMGNDSIVWTPSGVGTFYYQCVLHTEMVGKITIKN